MLRLSRDFGKREMLLRCIVADGAIACCRSGKRQGSNSLCAGNEMILLAMTQSKRDRLSPRPQFQALQPGRDADADLALHAERLQRDRVVRAADQRVAADADAEGRAALRADVITRKIARPQ